MLLQLFGKEVKVQSPKKAPDGDQNIKELLKRSPTLAGHLNAIWNAQHLLLYHRYWAMCISQSLQHFPEGGHLKPTDEETWRHTGRLGRDAREWAGG